MNVLAIGAHPDDIEGLCGGTLALYAERGAEVFMAIATNGEVGSPTLSREETAEMRHEEALASAKLIGAHLIWMGFPDEFLFDNRETRLRFIDAIREADPDVMFVHSPNDYHPDHRNAGRIAIDSRIPASVRLIETRFPASKIPHVFLCDTVGGIGFEPEVLVDVSSVFATKAEMLRAHKSQDAWIQDIFGCSYVDLFERHSSFRGLAASVDYAEGFRSLTTFPSTGGPDLLPTPTTKM